MSSTSSSPATKGSSRWSWRGSRGSTPAAVTPDNVSEVGDHLSRTSLDPGRDDADQAPALPTGDDLGLADELQGDLDTEQGKFKALLGILRKTISVKDLSSVRISLPANIMEPIGTLEHWTYIDRPDFFASLAALDDDADELERLLAVLRFKFTIWLKYAKHPIAKSFNSVLGEHFRAVYDTAPLELDPHEGHPVPTAHLDDNPLPEVLACAGRPSSSNNVTAAAALKSTPSVTSISRRPKPSSSTLPSSASSIASASSSVAPSSSAASSRPQRTARVVILNEQTSHHPPISHFLCEARLASSSSSGGGASGEPTERVVRLRGVDQLSAKFTGANVRIVPGQHNKGLFLELADGEEFHMTHPVAAVAGLIRASPYATISDVVTVTSVREGRGKAGQDGSRKRLRAIVEYREESWISRPRFAVEGVVYESVAGEVDGGGDKQQQQQQQRFSRIKQVPKERVVGTLEGNWRGEIRWKKAGETTSTTLVDLVPLAVAPKTVAPLSEQDELETRRVWAPVIDALHNKDFATASREKQRIEQAQRDKADERKKKGESYVPRFFEPEPEDVSTWDGRPVLSAAGRAVLEHDFRADYGGESAA
ncbi:uncharacterized protein RHOBADRAFT_55619 [Rhodotorula graminis WP1]|uniref:Oxysterol-binding protein n=1 Tax=Rhodotorula graminis (strain WP1) TaxID=578459 RepID=A0A0P9FA89_RHOGW|nr:uncharacterized protein RHOBADRAFT_55619 [Rhodotorula graminis WP1]KPV72514.1 hypothetical protein RHOBADRAFT_55619 [Rhodotorula graminis WP1]